MNGTIGRCAEALGAIGGGAVAATARIQGTMPAGAITIAAATTLLHIDTGRELGGSPAPSRASSNAAALSRIAADQAVPTVAGKPRTRSDPDGFDRSRARLLIRDGTVAKTDPALSTTMTPMPRSPP